jgi:ADP-L-glycero-D-manno-heptose 6-epimerase
MIIVTGGAGFIGSAVVAALNDRERDDIVLVDCVDHERKARNIQPLRFREIIEIKEFRARLLRGDYERISVTGVIHLGACADTTETNWDYLRDNNIDYSKDLISWCVRRGVRCLYASSAAVYGDGRNGFSDDHTLFDRLQPLNPYGKSKLLVDIWARDEGFVESVVGLRFFNVFGPNEWHKGGMRSVINKKFAEVRDSGSITLFKSYHPAYADGSQERDFIYVRDVADATLWFLDHPEASGVFNIGTGEARTWNDVARAMFAALTKPADIRYVDMPANLREQYQYHTQADITKLRRTGYGASFTPLEHAILDYVRRFLVMDLHLRE